MRTVARNKNKNKKNPFNRNIRRNYIDDQIHKDFLKWYVHMFKDLKKNINKRNREIEDIEEDQMGLLELGNTWAKMKIWLNVINSSLHTRKDQWMWRHINRNYMK